MADDPLSIQERLYPGLTCFGCGQANPSGLRLRSHAGDGVVRATFLPWPEHDNGFGYVDGGIISTVLDCHSAAAVLLEAQQRGRRRCSPGEPPPPLGGRTLPSGTTTARRFAASRPPLGGPLMSTPPAPSRRLWQAAGALALAHIALMLAGFTLMSVGHLGDAPGAVVHTYRASSLFGAQIGSAVSLLGFLALFAAVPLLARLLRGRSDGSHWLAAVLSASGYLYIGLTFALPFAASAAARYEAHRGLPTGTVTALSDLHWFGVDTATVLLGVFTLAVSTATWATRPLPRWVAVGGFVAGAACLAAALDPPESVVDDVTLIWMIWFVALGVAALVAGRARTRRTAVPAAA